MPSELEKLEDALKENVSFELLKEESTAGALAPIVRGVFFERVLNNTLPW